VSGDNAISLMVQKFYDQMVQKKPAGVAAVPVEEVPVEV